MQTTVFQNKCIHLLNKLDHLLRVKHLYYVDPNSTHQKFLTSSIEHLIKNRNPEQQIWLFELGTGGMSSKIMYKYMSEKSFIYLNSFENDSDWLNKHRSLYPTNDRFKLIEINNDDWSKPLIDTLNDVPENAMLLAFIDSNPWISRVQAMNILEKRSEIFLIHDVDYFPHNKLFGCEHSPILFKKKKLFKYGKLERANLGKRTYSDVAKYWIEVFPEVPGFYTGPPTLIASNRLNVLDIFLPEGTIIFSSIE